METGEAALCGAIDEATLVCVSAGICLANLIVTPKLDDQQGTQETLELSRRGLRINLLFGDFIEVAYPFMERSSPSQRSWLFGQRTFYWTADWKLEGKCWVVPICLCLWLSS